MHASILPERLNLHSPFKLMLICLTLLIAACGGGTDSNTNDGSTDTTNDDNSIDTDDSITVQESPVLQVSDIRTLGEPSTPIIVYNDSGDGVAIWEVTGIGRWLYYSIYDHSSSSWSEGKVLTAVSNYSYILRPQLVSNGTGFAVAWPERTDSGYMMFATLYNDTEWSLPSSIDSDVIDYNNSIQLTSNGIGYAATWERNDQIYVNLSIDGTAWIESVNINGNTTINKRPRIASDGIGYAVIWSADDRLATNIYSGTNWGNAEFLDNDTDMYFSYLETSSIYDITGKSNGYTFIWVSDELSTLWSRTYYNMDEEYWSPKISLYDGVTTGYLKLSAATIHSNGTGYALAYVTSNNDSEDKLYIRVKFSDDRDWSPSTLLDESDVPVSFRTIYLITDGNTYAAAWMYSNHIHSYTHVSVYDGATWNDLSLPIIAQTYDKTPPSLAAFNGQYVITWNQEVSGVENIFASVYTHTTGWKNIESLEDGSGEAQKPSIAVNPLDGIIVAWNQFSESGSDIASYSNSYDGTDWNGETILTPGNYYVGSSYDPRLLSNGKGKILAVWTQDRNGKLALFTNFYEKGIWGTPILLSDSVTFYSHTSTPHIATDGNGFAIVWQEDIDDSSNSTVYISIYDGYNWSNAEYLYTGSIWYYNSTQHSISSNGSGYMVVYDQYNSDTDLYSIFARHYDNVTWSAPVLLTDTLVHGYPQIATNGDTYLSTWYQNYGIYSSEFDGTSWSSAQLIASDIRLPYYPSLKLLLPSEAVILRLVSNGNEYLAVWFQYGNVMANFYSDNWGIPTVLGAAGHASYLTPVAPHAVSNNSGFAVAWISSTDAGTAVAVNVHDGTIWSGVTNLRTDSSEYVDFSLSGTINQLAAATDNYAVVWYQNTYDGDSVNSNVHASVFDGNSWSNVKSLDIGSSYINSLQLASDGTNFLAVWLENNDSGVYDVISNRYEGNNWNGAVVLDVDSHNTFDLSLLGDWYGFHTIWTQAEPYGDPMILYPWSKLGF